MPMRKMLILAVAGLAVGCLAACTPAEETTAVAGIQAACALAAAGSTVYVQVESSDPNAKTPQKISQEVQSGVAAGCPAVVSAAQAAVNTVTASGATATLTVSTSDPSTPTAKAKRRVFAKVRFKAVAPGQIEATYVIKPGVDVGLPKLPTITLPFIGTL